MVFPCIRYHTTLLIVLNRPYHFRGVLLTAAGHSPPSPLPRRRSRRTKELHVNCGKRAPDQINHKNTPDKHVHMHVQAFHVGEIVL